MSSSTRTSWWSRFAVCITAMGFLSPASLTAAHSPGSAPDAGNNPPQGFRPVLHARADAERSGAFHHPPMRQMPREAWRTQLAQQYLGTPLVSDGVLYTGGSDGSLYAIETQTGGVLWSTGGFEYIESATVLAGDVIIGGGQSKRVMALNRRDGSVMWSFDASAFVFAAPLIVGDLVYIATYDQLHALDLRSGVQRWSADTGDQPVPVSSPAYLQGTIYLSAGPRVLAFDSETGAERWRAESPTMFWSLALGKKAVYVGNSDGYFRAYDPATGQERWRFKSAWGLPDEIWSAPAVASNVVYVGSRDQFVYALDAGTGQMIWGYKTAGDAVGDPVVSNGLVYVSDSNHALPPGLRRLHALDAETGTELWRYEVQSTLLTNPVPAKGALYVTIEGQVIALE